MLVLIFDTETTGLVDRRLPPDDAAQPHLVQLAALLVHETGKEMASVSLIVRPPVSIPDEAAAIHGITNAIASAAGIAPAAALGMWSNLARRADMVVAHNIAFDWAVMHTAWLRCHPGEAGAESWERVHGARERACTMRMAAPVVNLPPTERMAAAGMNVPKAPKLSECIRHFFDEDLEGAHDALVDVRACARVFHHLRSMEREAA